MPRIIPSRTLRQRDLDRIWLDYQDDALLQLGTNFVPGKGSLTPTVVLVGEAPGATEDRTGAPFVGASGQVLDRLLMAAEMTREQLWITNVVKSRPAGNRTPTDVEARRGKHYLDQELDVLQPQVVGLMGAVATRMYFGDVRITSVHGTFTVQQHRKGYRCYVALFHPAVALYDRKQYDMLEADFLIMKDVINSGGLT